jgi:putative hydrolase of the HAD superfamily
VAHPRVDEHELEPGRFDAVLFDAGGVLVLPDPTVLGPLLAFYGGDTSLDLHRRAHYAGMRAKSAANAAEGTWHDYDHAYVDAIGVDPAHLDEAAVVLGRTRTEWLWRWMIPETRHALDRLALAGVPMGVVSNASGQIDRILRREVCQPGAGDHIAMRCVIDSHVVGVAKPDPAIFDHALVHFAGIERSRIIYVGDSVTMDVGAARAAGLRPVLLDPYDDHPGADFDRIRAVADLLPALIPADGSGPRRGRPART